MGWCSRIRRKFAKLRIDCQQQKMQPPLCTGDISVIGLFTGVPQRGSVKPVNCIHTHSFQTCCSLLYKISKITMLELGSRQNIMDMETERATGKCTANTLVCQLCWIFLLIACRRRRFWRTEHKMDDAPASSSDVKSGAFSPNDPSGAAPAF